MNPFVELCRANRGDTDQETAAAILASLRVNKTASEVLLGVVSNAVRITFRNETREAEWALEVEDVESGSPVNYQKLVGESFALPDGRRVLWSEATISDHEERIAYLLRMRNGLDTTIARHQAAIQSLRMAAA